ncbi:MAG: hypothetical protein WCP18_02195 [bacterium]
MSAKNVLLTSIIVTVVCISGYTIWICTYNSSKDTKAQAQQQKAFEDSVNNRVKEAVAGMATEVAKDADRAKASAEEAKANAVAVSTSADNVFKNAKIAIDSATSATKSATESKIGAQESLFDAALVGKSIEGTKKTIAEINATLATLTELKTKMEGLDKKINSAETERKLTQETLGKRIDTIDARSKETKESLAKTDAKIGETLDVLAQAKGGFMRKGLSKRTVKEIKNIKEESPLELDAPIPPPPPSTTADK